MKKKLLFLLTLALVGVKGAWATVTATLSGMNKVGDYYYPVYTLSESSSISSFTSSNGVDPAAITDGTTLTFSHRGTVTLESGETFEGKKYARTMNHDLTAFSDFNSKDDAVITGFTTASYKKVQVKTGISDTNTSRYAGVTITNNKDKTPSGKLYLDWYYTSSSTRYGMKPNTNSATFTITSGETVACMEYYYNGGAIPKTLNLAPYATSEWKTGDNISFDIKLDDSTSGKYYLYKNLSAYTEVDPSLTEAIATLSGFADDGFYAYPVYTITVTHDEDGIVEPTLSDGANYTTSGNVLSYITSTDAAATVSISYDGMNTTVDVPASVKYLKREYDLANLKTYTGTQTSAYGSFGGFSDASGTRYTIYYGTNSTPSSPNSGEAIAGMSFASSEYGWHMLPNYGLQINGAKDSTYNITISDVANGYAILYHKIGANPSITWNSAPVEAEDIVADIDGTITLSLKEKNHAYYAYTKIDLYVPAANYVHTVYNLASRSSYPSTIAYKDQAGSINGFTDATGITRYTLSASNTETALYNVTLNAQFGWVLCEGYGAYFSDDDGEGTFKVTNPIAGQFGVLSYKIGDKSSTTTWSLGTQGQQYVYAYNDNLAFDAYDKDGKHSSNKSWTYTQLDLFTPIANAKQNVSVNVAVGGMGTLVADHPMDFSDDDLKAYIASIEGTTVTFTRIEKVPAYTPVLVKYKNAETAAPSISFCNAEDAETVSTNALKAGTGAAVATYPDDTHTNFVLTTGNSGASHGFYFANGRTVATNRAYLQADTKIAAATARLNIAFSDDETTDIDIVNKDGNHANGCYNLSGQRVAQPSKGLYIVNGKKMIVK